MNGKFLLIVDVEGTCDEVETDAIRGPNREMIELGAVKIDPRTGDEVDHFQAFVRPTVNPALTTFCRQLLQIEQSDVDAADTFPAVAQSFQSWVGDDVVAWASWGNYDVYQWGHDAERFGLNPELPWQHINLKKAFGKAMGIKRRGLGGAYAEFGLEMEEDRHRALNDARHIARLLRLVPAFLAYVQRILPDTLGQA